MMYFTPYSTLLPSWTSELSCSPCGKHKTVPNLGLTSIVSKQPNSLLLGLKNVVAPPTKSSLR